MNTDTDLHFYALEGDGPSPQRLPLCSARGCSQVLRPVASESQRTLSGALVMPLPPWGKKYHTLITCQDIHPAALEGLWPGDHLMVHCVVRFMTPFLTPGQSIKLHRAPVQGSFILQTSRGDCPMDVPVSADWHVQLPPSVPEGGFLSYRPALRMLLLHMELASQEWKRIMSWKMELEEL